MAEKQKREEQLVLNDNWFRELYEYSPLMYFIIDSDGYVLSANKKGAEVLGYRHNELIGQQVIDVFHPDDKKQVLKQIKKCLKEPEEVHNWEFRKIRKDGSMLWVKESARVISEDGRRFLFIICEDISEQKRAEADLKQKLFELAKKNRYEKIISTVSRSVNSSINLQDVLEHAVEALSNNIDKSDNVAIYMVEGEEAVLRAQAGLADWFIKKAGRMPYKKGYTWNTLIEGKSSYTADVDIDKTISPAGRKLGLKSYLSVPINFEGRTVGCININSFEKNAFDEEELKLLEILSQQIVIAINNARHAEALKQSEEALRKSEEHFRLLIETTNVIPWKADVQTQQFTYVGPQVQGLLGYPVEKWYEQDFWPSHIHPDDREKTMAKCLESAAKKKDYELEYRMISSDGKIVWIHDLVSVFTEAEKPQTIRGFMIDITERKQAEELATQLGKILEESLTEVYIADTETLKFLQVNEGARKNLGYTLEELQNMNPLNIKTNLDEESFHNLVDPLLSGKVDKVKNISTHRRKDGSVYPVETYLQTSTFKDRKVFVANVRDITESQRTHSLLLSEKKILEMISQGNELSEILEYICLEIENQSKQMLCSFLLVDDSGNSLVTYSAPNLPQDYLDNTQVVPIGQGKGSCGTAAYLKRQVIVEDIESDPLWSKCSYLALKNNLRACWSTPILSKSGDLLGTYAMYFREPHYPNDAELDLIERATHLARIAIERKNAEETLKENLDILSKKSRYDEIISTVTRSVHSSINFQDVFDNAVESLSKNMVKAQHVSILMIEGNDAVLKAYRGLPEWFAQKLEKIPYPKGFTWKVLTEGKLRYCPDVDLDEYIGPTGREIGTKSYLSMPYKYKGNTIGCINLHSFEKNAFSEDEINLLEFVAQQIEVAIGNAKQAEALRESEERYRTLYDQSPLGVFTFDKDIKITSSNKRLLEILRSYPEGIQGLELKKLKDQKFTYLYERALQGYPGHHKNSYMTTRSNIKLWLSISAAPLKDADGNILGGMAVVEDVTARKEMEERLGKSQKLESLGILAGGIAHDFNNLLTSIMGNLGTAKTNPNIDKELLNLISESEEASARAAVLVSQLLTFSKGGAPAKKLFSDLSDFIIDIAKFAVSGSKSRCEFSIEKNLWSLEADEAQISQVIQNLVMNAQQAMSEGGTIKVSVNNHTTKIKDDDKPEDGKYIRITIEDSGMGIPAENLNKIFYPYFTTKEKGHGLGLSSVYSIVKNHDGIINVKSQVGIGTKFEVFLPASDKPSDTSVRTDDKLTEGRGKILLMDDENLIKIATGRMLKKLGYEVEFASDGEEAVNKYKQSMNNGRFDLVIMDLTVPGGMGGCEATKILRSIDPDVKIVVSSGYSNDPVMSDYKKYGFVDIVRKPYRVEVLSSTIENVLSSKSQ